MQNQIAARSARRMLLILLAALAPGIAGCPPPTIPGPVTGLPGYPGQDAAATKAYLASLDFTQLDSIFDGWIPCHNASDCTGDSIHIRIVPEKKAYLVPIEGALHGGPGYIVAKIINLDSKPYDSWKLAANDTTYLWVGALPAGGRKVAIFRISAITGIASGRVRAEKVGWCAKSPGMERSVAAVHINSMTECNSHTFYTASGLKHNHVHVASASNDLVPGSALRAFAHSSGLWFSCPMGCCEASEFASLL